MIRPLFKRVFPHVLAWASVFAISAAIALAQGSTPAAAAGQRTDGQIEMDVVHALDASQTLKNDLITAATIQGEVTLAGTVSSESSKELAESICGKVPGVTKVHNNLKVGNPQDAQNEQPPVDETGPGVADNGSQPNPGNQPEYAPIPPPDGASGQPQYPEQGQGQAPPPYPGYLPNPAGQSQYAQPAPPAYEMARGPVTVTAGTLLQLRTIEPLDTRRAVDGTPVQFTVIRDVTQGGVLAIPRGATVHGVVTQSKQVKAGQLAGSPELALTLTSLDLGGKNYNLQSDQFKVKGPNKAGHTVGDAIGGGLIGAIFGCVVGRGVGCAIGAGAGLAAGTAASAASRGPNVWIPAEALVDFHLAAPVTVDPVSQQEVARLAQGLYSGGPTLHRRGYYPYGTPYSPYGRPYPAAYPYYAYPPVYYRPYYMMGGFNYWR